MIDDGCKTDEEIQMAIDACLTSAEYSDLIGKLKFEFVGELPNANVTGLRLKPQAALLINRAVWKNASEKDRLNAIRSRVCHIMACVRVGKMVEFEGPEWRVYALKTGVIYAKPANEFDQTFLIAPKW